MSDGKFDKDKRTIKYYRKYKYIGEMWILNKSWETDIENSQSLG